MLSERYRADPRIKDVDTGEGEEVTLVGQEMEKDTDETQDAGHIFRETAKNLKRQLAQHREVLITETKELRTKGEKAVAGIPSRIATGVANT